MIVLISVVLPEPVPPEMRILRRALTAPSINRAAAGEIAVTAQAAGGALVVDVSDDGRGIDVNPGEPGLLLGHIKAETVFEGYTDPEATEKKIIRNAFADDDAWFNTGDLLREMDVGFNLGYPHYQFVDRVGDTFRWRSENVSTNEVGEIINTGGEWDGIVVGKVGTATVSQSELLQGLIQTSENNASKYKSLNEISQLCRKLRKNRKRIVMTNGCFDLLHAGHIRLFSASKQLGDVMIVAIDDDDSVKLLKGAGRPVIGAMMIKFLLTGGASLSHLQVTAK